MNIARNRRASRRLFIMLWGKILFCLLILLRLYKLQVKDYVKYHNISLKNSTATLKDPAPRGRIFDRNNNLLAVNKNSYHLAYRPMEKSNESLDKLIATLSLDYDNAKKVKMMSLRQSKRLLPIMDNITWEQFYRTEVNLHKLPGVVTLVKKVRHYPYRHLAAHVVGYTVNKHNDLKITQHNINTNTPAGKVGIEKFCNDDLTGVPGTNKARINVYGNSIGSISRIPPQKGSDVRVSIDIIAQRYAAEIMKNHPGCIIAMDLHTGQLLVAYSNPSFDPNNFVEGIDYQKWAEIKNNKDFPLLNRFASNAVPPGSLFKLVTAMAALHSSVLMIGSTVNCTGQVKIGNRVARCWKHYGHGKVDLPNAIAASCNPFFYEIAKVINIDILVNVAKELGFGAATNIETGNEQEGLLPESEWRKQKLKNRWFLGDTVNIAIGQGYVLATPIQILTMVARIATGVKITPTLLCGNTQPYFAKLPFADAHLDIIRQGMYRTVHAPHGTAFAIRGSLEIAGKTGTVQISSRVNVNRDEEKTHAVFAGYAPFRAPKVAVMVLLDKAGSGAKVAAPKVKEMLKQLSELGYV